MLRWSARILGFLALVLANQANAEVVTLASLERRALQSESFAATHAARARGSESEIRKAAAAYYPQVSLRLETNAQPGRNLVRVCAAGDMQCQTESLANPGKELDQQYTVAGARQLGDDGAFKPIPQNRLEIAATAPIYDFGRTKSAVKAGEASLEAVKAERDAEAENIVRNVRVAYLNWLSAYALASVTEAAAKDAEERFARVRALVEQGQRPKAELPPAHSDALLTKLELTRSRGDLGNARQTLEEVVGEPLPTDAEPELGLIETADQQMVALSQATDALARVIEKQRSAAEKLELSYKKQRMPQLGLAALVGMRNQRDAFFPLYNVGASFVVPLYDGGVSSASAAGARAQRDALDSRLHAHARDQERAYDKAQRDAQQALDSLAIAQELLAVTEKQLTDAQAGYDLGVNGINQIADARAVMRRAQTEVLLAKVAHAEALMRFRPVHSGSN